MACVAAEVADDALELVSAAVAECELLSIGRVLDGDHDVALSCDRCCCWSGGGEELDGGVGVPHPHSH